MKHKEFVLVLKITMIIGAFLYALSEMCAENIHWAIGDLILLALWIGGKSIFREIKGVKW